MKSKLIKTTLAVFLFGGMSHMALADEFANGFIAAQKSDYAKAAAKWEPLAKDHPRAQFLLGTMYHSGAAGQYDEKKAVALYHKAAENGVREAQEYLAVAYAEGWFGLKKDPRKAQYWQQRLEQTP